MDGYVHKIVAQDYTDGDSITSGRNTAHGPKAERTDDRTGIESLLQAQIISLRAEYEKNLTDLQKKVSTSSKSEQELMQALDRLKSTHEELQSQLEQSKLQLATSEKSLNQVNKKLTTVTTLARDLEKKYKSEQAIADSLMKRLSHLENTCKEAEANAKRWKDESAGHEATCAVSAGTTDHQWSQLTLS